MGILRTDRVSGLGGANAITGSVFFGRNGVPATASGNWLTLFSEEDFKFGTGDFTIEAWIYYTGTTSSSNSGWFQISNTVGGINNSNTASAGGLAGDFENGVIKGIGNNGWFNGSVSVTAYSWIHVAMVRHSGTLQWFVNGAADTSASDSNDYSLTHLAIGGYYTTSYLFSGYISNFRVQKGKAEYTAAFTPPTTRLEKTPETVVLACQSPGNILQEATGKTLFINRVNTNDAPPQASHFTPNSPVGFSTTTDVGTQFGSTFDGVTTFDSQAYFVPPGGNTKERNRGRGFYAIGFANPTQSNVINYLNIQSSGNTEDFGDLTVAKYNLGSGASSTRGIFMGGYDPTSSPDTDINSMEFITIATTGNATDFGDRTVVGRAISAVSSSTRVVMAGGITPSGTSNVIDFITTATTGNASDFGDLLSANNAMCTSNNSSTRGIFAGGNAIPSSPYNTNVIQFVTIASAGDATDFGDLTVNARDAAGGTASSSTRGLICIGNSHPNNNLNTVDFITMASAGNASDFGDLFTGRYSVSSCSNSNRAVFLGGRTTSPSVVYQNAMEFVTISTTGNTSDFGDIMGATGGTGMGAANSDSHGGLS